VSSSKEKQILEVGDFVKAVVDDENCIVSVRERIGNYVLLANGIRFHILDDRIGEEGRWIHRSTGFIVELP
jgi:hypothetical protein